MDAESVEVLRREFTDGIAISAKLAAESSKGGAKADPGATVGGEKTEERE